MSRLVRKQVYITAEQEQRLKLTAARERRSEADLIREALDRRLNPRRKPSRRSAGDTLWAIVGVASGPPGDVSEDVDDYLYGSRVR